VLWDQDARIALPLLQRLRQVPGLVVGDNEPYTERDETGFTLRHHGAARGIPHVGLEIRQDEITSAEGEARYADLLRAALSPIL
jgi:predicted N-formylglutamate amidohydrolase